MILMTEKQIEGMTSEQQAKKAIAHVLQQIRDNPDVGWYLGLGTQSFSLLTEAAATLFAQPLDEVREQFQCRNARDPREQTEEDSE